MGILLIACGVVFGVLLTLIYFVNKFKIQF